MATEQPKSQSNDDYLVRMRADGVGVWLFLTVGLMLVFKACGVSLW
jgi:hypothetical protein